MTVKTFTSHFSHQADRLLGDSFSSLFMINPFVSVSGVEFLSQLNKRAPLLLSVSSVMLGFVERMPFGVNTGIDLDFSAETQAIT